MCWIVQMWYGIWCIRYDTEIILPNSQFFQEKIEKTLKFQKVESKKIVLPIVDKLFNLQIIESTHFLLKRSFITAKFSYSMIDKCTAEISCCSLITMFWVLNFLDLNI